VPDAETYFGSFSADAIFLGTAATERWDVAGFRAYAEPYFSQGRGWTYLPFDRHIQIAASGRSAWFDERLRNEKYGELRGTGVAVREAGEWRIAHYNMCFPVPNDVTRDLVDLIRAAAAAPDGAGD